MLFPDFLYKKYSYYVDTKHRQKSNKTLHGYKDSRRIRDSGKLIRNQIGREIYAYHVYSTAFKSSQKIIKKMEFLAINLTKNSSLLLHANHRPFFWRILNTTIIVFKNPYKKSVKQENSSLSMNSIS
jgi:hypothetical protein